jgi:ribose/xylose/arabinose/galactoside ABC-type transport system permease subunit
VRAGPKAGAEEDQMNTLLNTRALALSGAAACAVLNVVCASIYAIAGRPDPWMDLFIGSGPTIVGSIVFIAEGAAVGALLGWLVAVCYNRLAKPAAVA